MLDTNTIEAALVKAEVIRLAMAAPVEQAGEEPDDPLMPGLVPESEEEDESLGETPLVRVWMRRLS